MGGDHHSGFILADQPLQSRLLVGSACYSDPATMVESIEASGAQVVTVSMRRISTVHSQLEGILHYLKSKKLHILPNTAGCFTAKEAILTAQLAREALKTDWIKLEVIGDSKTLFPDVVELLKAARCVN